MYVRNLFSNIFWPILTRLVVVVRVSYVPEVLNQLGVWATAKNSPFSVEDRMGLVNDAITLAKAGTSSTSGALDLIAVLKSETESTLAFNSQALYCSCRDVQILSGKVLPRQSCQSRSFCGSNPLSFDRSSRHLKLSVFVIHCIFHSD